MYLKNKAAALLAIMVSLVMAATLGAIAQSPAQASASSPSIDVLSYNVRNPAAVVDYPERPWSTRKGGLINVIETHDPDIFGLQELTDYGSIDPSQDMINYFSGTYDYYDDVSASSPKVIFWRKSRFSQVNDAYGSPRNGYHEYDNSGVPGDAQLQSDCSQTRRMTWTVLQDNTNGSRYFVANTHLHSIEECVDFRSNAVRQIHETIVANNPENYPIILMGDFNNRPAACYDTDATHLGSPIASLAETSNSLHPYNLNTRTLNNDCDGTTNRGWDRDYTNDIARVDHIFFSAALSYSNYGIDTRISRTMDDGYRTSPSDHYAIYMTLTP